jgi:hypothetical protein
MPGLSPPLTARCFAVMSRCAWSAAVPAGSPYGRDPAGEKVRKRFGARRRGVAQHGHLRPAGFLGKVLRDIPFERRPQTVFVSEPPMKRRLVTPAVI